MQLENPAITFLFDHNGATLEIYDRKSSITFVKVKLNAEQVCQMLSRLGNTDCECRVEDLDKVGKKMIHKELVFPLAKCDWSEEKKCAVETLKDFVPEGWEADTYFGSQNSFFTKDNIRYARTTIRTYQ